MQQEPKSRRKRAGNLISLLATDLVPDWRPSREQVVWTVRILIALVFLQALFFLAGSWLWEVLVNYIDPRKPSERKNLVNVFVLIGAGVVGFLTATAAVGNLYMSRRNLEQQRILEEERAQDDALQAYYTQIGDLLTEHDLKEMQRDEDVALLARAQTLTIVGRVNAVRNGALVRFLYGANLISGDRGIVDLRGADLGGTYLRDADLGGSYLDRADLSSADLRSANLRRADLSNADLRSADLRGADLDRAALHGADLRGANLFGANLFGAYLRDADLGGTNLGGTNLRRANLSSAREWAVEQLREARSLEGATMPNGQILRSGDNPDGPTFEEWLKNKGREEDGENSRPS